MLIFWLYCTFRTDSELSHRQLYDAVSLYWHCRGRAHLLFVPAIQVAGILFLSEFTLLANLCPQTELWPKM